MDEETKTVINNVGRQIANLDQSVQNLTRILVQIESDLRTANILSSKSSNQNS